MVAVRRVTRFLTCKPTLRDTDLLEKGLEQEGKRLGLGQDRIVVARAHVPADGTVAEVRLERSSGNLLVDVAVSGLLKSAQFPPAMIEGFVVSVWIEVPLSCRR